MEGPVSGDVGNQRIDTAVAWKVGDFIVARQEPTLLGVGGIVQDFKDAASGSIGHALEVLKSVFEWTDDEGIVKGKRSFDQIEAYRSS